MSLNTLRRAIGIMLLVAIPISAAESVVGLLRDGAVHHESPAAAAEHAALGIGQGHGHDDRVPTHQHGSPADHCTHVHGVAVTTTPLQVAFDAPLSVDYQVQRPIRHDWSPLEELPPPRA